VVTTFADEYLAGRIPEEDIHDWIDRWHDGDHPEELHEFLGLTWPEYSAWVERDELPVPESRLGGPQLVVLQGGEELIAHSPASCVRPCAIHWPRNHHMRSWPQHWRWDREIIERVCDHEIGHPDPDDKNRNKVHGCDGCCTNQGPEVFQ
jgi:hypothetical protein